jgi:CBS domain containing-hemolysin-like protein
MKGMRNITAILAALAAGLILFVVVCPITPTPIAVVTASGKAPAPAVALLAAAMLLIPFAFRVQRSSACYARVESFRELPHADLVDLTCTRLC